jgi:hypothetical protein
MFLFWLFNLGFMSCPPHITIGWWVSSQFQSFWGVVKYQAIKKMLPMSSNSNGTSSSLNNGMEGKVLGSKLTWCVYNLPKKKKELRNSSIFLCYHSLWFWDILKDFIGRFINRFFKIMRIFYGRTSSMYRRKGSSRVFLLGWCAACRWCHAIKKKLTLVKKYLLIIICKCTICFARCVLLFVYSLL